MATYMIKNRTTTECTAEVQVDHVVVQIVDQGGLMVRTVAVTVISDPNTLGAVWVHTTRGGIPEAPYQYHMSRPGDDPEWMHDLIGWLLEQL